MMNILNGKDSIYYSACMNWNYKYTSCLCRKHMMSHMMNKLNLVGCSLRDIECIDCNYMMSILVDNSNH